MARDRDSWRYKEVAYTQQWVDYDDDDDVMYAVVFYELSSYTYKCYFYIFDHYYFMILFIMVNYVTVFLIRILGIPFLNICIQKDALYEEFVCLICPYFLHGCIIWIRTTSSIT